jgi:hypothetical protein
MSRFLIGVDEQQNNKHHHQKCHRFNAADQPEVPDVELVLAIKRNLMSNDLLLIMVECR